jgi:hypothetical protein
MIIQNAMIRIHGSALRRGVSQPPSSFSNVYVEILSLQDFNNAESAFV